ncbi:unnamed protein product, partial [Brachionus calyciflorus]
FEQVNYILTALAVADNGFLTTLLVVYLNRFGINLFDNYKIICKLNVFCGYVFSFLSTWYVVLFSIERVIAVYFPIKRFEICNSNRNKLSVVFLGLISMFLYSYSFVTSDLETYKNKSVCVTLEKWFEFVNYMAFADIFLTMIIPFFLISASNILIVIKLMQIKNPFQKNESNYLKRSVRIDFSSLSNCENRNQTMSTEFDRNCSTISHLARNSSLLSYNSNSNSIKRKVSFIILRNSDKRKRKKSYTRTTRLLLIVSSTFLILNTPMALCKITNFFKIDFFQRDDFVADIETYTTLNEQLNMTGNYSITNGEFGYKDINIGEIFERFASYVYYLNFSLNFFLYSFNKSKFKKALTRAKSFRSRSRKGESV